MAGGRWKERWCRHYEQKKVCWKGSRGAADPRKCICAYITHPFESYSRLVLPTLSPACVKTGSHVEISADDIVTTGFKAKPCPFIWGEKILTLPYFSVTISRPKIWTHPHRVNTAQISSYYLWAKSRIRSCFVYLRGDGFCDFLLGEDQSGGPGSLFYVYIACAIGYRDFTASRSSINTPVSCSTVPGIIFPSGPGQPVHRCVWKKYAGGLELALPLSHSPEIWSGLYWL